MISFLARILALKLVRDRYRAKKGHRPRLDRPAPTGGRSAAPPETTYDEEPIPPQRAGRPGPDTPLDLPAPDWKSTLKRTVKEIRADRMTLIAAGMAYYLFLAIFPALIAFTGILGLFEIDTQPIIEAVRSNLPGESGALIVQAVEGSRSASDTTSLWATLVGIALALWSASSGFVALQKGLNVAYDVPQDRKFIGARAIALLLIIFTGFLGGVPSPVFTFGEGTVFTILGWALTVIAVMLLFSIYYYLGPAREKPTWQWVSAGGVAGAVIWIIASAGFGLYAGDPGRYAKTYGATGAVIALIFWLFLTSASILIGGELNAELERQAERRKRRTSPAPA